MVNLVAALITGVEVSLRLRLAGLYFFDALGGQELERATISTGRFAKVFDRRLGFFIWPDKKEDAQLGTLTY